MATQLISVLKVAGSAGDFVRHRLREWAAKRQGEQDECSSCKSPPEVRQEIDHFAEVLRSHAGTPPIIHFVEWIDMWSMGDMIDRWLGAGMDSAAIRVHGERCELFGYFLPDEGMLARRLAEAGPQQFPETDWFIMRLQEALISWEKLTDRSILLVCRQVVGPTVMDEELLASLQAVPTWLMG